MRTFFVSNFVFCIQFMHKCLSSWWSEFDQTLFVRKHSTLKFWPSSISSGRLIWKLHISCRYVLSRNKFPSAQSYFFYETQAFLIASFPLSTYKITKTLNQCIESTFLCFDNYNRTFSKIKKRADIAFESVIKERSLAFLCWLMIFHDRLKFLLTRSTAVAQDYY